MDYSLKISNKYYDTLVYPDLLMNLIIYEQAFGDLPIFSLIFQDYNIDKIRTLTELSSLDIIYNVNNIEYKSSWVIKVVKIQEFDSGFYAGLHGYLNKFEYYKNNKIPYVSGTSQEALNKIASAYFTFKDVGTPSQDKMNWLSFTKSDAKFLEDVWQHSYIPNDLTLIGIDSSGNFIRTTLLSQLNQGTKTLFSLTDKKEGVTYQEVKPVSNSLNSTSIFGYDSCRVVVDEKEGNLNQASFKQNVVMTPSSTLNQSKEIKQRRLIPAFQTDNTHPKYIEAKSSNLSMLASLLTNSITVTTNDYCNLGLLDIFRVEELERNFVRRTFNGLYITTGILRTFDNIGNMSVAYTGFREVSEEIK